MKRLLVRAAPPAHFPWIAQRTGCKLTPEAEGIEAIDRDGRIRGMVLYDCWTENAVQCHMAFDTPIAVRSMLVPCFFYPFDECNRGLMLATIPAHNVRSRDLAEHFGFRETHRIRDGWNVGDDLVMFEMRREECRFLRRDKAA